MLNELIDIAHEQNNSLKIAGLRVLESRAQLGIAIGNQYPQSQAVVGDATALRASENAANTGAGDLEFTQFNIGVVGPKPGASQHPPVPALWCGHRGTEVGGDTGHEVASLVHKDIVELHSG